MEVHGGQKTNKVTRYPRSLGINLGMVIFAVILVYIIISLVTFFRTDHVVGYEVKEGSLTGENVFRAIALRSEHVIPGAADGYVNYFASEGTRVAVGNLVYTVDENGGLLDLLAAEGSESVTFSEKELQELRTQMVNFTSVFNEHEYNTVYDFKNTLKGTAQKLTNASILSRIQSLNDSRSRAIGYYSADKSGIVVYYIDGFEDTAFEDVTAAMLEEESIKTDYEKELLAGNALINTGDPVYKLIDSEDWQVVLLTDTKRARELAEEEYVRVRFLKNQDECWGRVDVRDLEEDMSLVSLTFSNSMITFCTDRYLDIELMLNSERGLKIPKSAVVEKKFYLVPNSYVTMGEQAREGVLREVHLEDGTKSVEFVPVEIYHEKNRRYYLDDQVLQAGDVLQMPDSGQTFTVGAADNLEGVYNINKGYADFRRVEKLSENEEYMIVETGAPYSLNVYDFIVLDAETVSENDLIYD